MKTVFVMIKCHLGKTYEVAEHIADEIEEVRSVYSTSGQYDLLTQFQLDADQDIGRFIATAIHATPGVKDTYTIIGLNAFTDTPADTGADAI